MAGTHGISPNVSEFETLVSLALQRLANQCGRDDILNQLLELTSRICLPLRIIIFEKPRPVSSNSVLGERAVGFQLKVVHGGTTTYIIVLLVPLIFCTQIFGLFTTKRSLLLSTVIIFKPFAIIPRVKTALISMIWFKGIINS